MIPIESLRKLALSFPETYEEPHFEKTSFRVKKKIFVTYYAQTNTAVIKLSEVLQHVFSAADPASVYPVNNKWGKQGWTTIAMNTVNPDLFADAITTAYCEVAPTDLAKQVRPAENT
ncbi:MAG: MmcQ/YjbR family DNA-binding protein [Bacteroidetes bacterium]|nr:MmcQ/YjbR family DNA-binding protein [Bacteroidota bacterium]